MTSLLEYISDMARRSDLADRIGTSPDYLWQLATKWRGKKASRVMAIAIETATGGAVQRSELRPDLFPTAEPAANDGGEVDRAA